MKLFIRTLYYTLLTAFVLGLGTYLQACKKDKPKPQPGEQVLRVSLEPEPSSSTTPVVSAAANYSFRVKVESQMPSQGVTVDVVYRQDSGGEVLFSETYTTTTSPQNVTITNLPFNEVGTVTVVVTSKTQSSNTQTKTFKLVKK